MSERASERGAVATGNVKICLREQNQSSEMHRPTDQACALRARAANARSIHYRGAHCQFWAANDDDGRFAQGPDRITGC